MDKTVKKTVVKYKPLSAENDSAFKTERSLDTITFSGSYFVEIIHNGADVGLPIADCGDEHYIVGTLFVTDSGTGGSKQRNRVIGQLLTLTSRECKDTKVYSRTNADGKWGKWRSFVYSGVYDKISVTEELLASVEELVNATKILQTNLAGETKRAVDSETELQYKIWTVYAAGENLFFHDTKDDYKNLDVNTYILGEHYICVEAGKDIVASGNVYSVNARIYDSCYEYINTIQVKANKPLTLPDNCSYIKWDVAVYDLINKSKIMVNYGTEVLPYSPFLTSLALELSGNIEEVSNLLSVVNAKVDGKDAITEQVLDFTSAYQWQKLSTPIKAGSIIEVLGAGTRLNFYEKQFGTATLINGSDEAVAGFTYVRSLDITGKFNIKVTERSKIGILEDKVETIENKVDAFEDKVGALEDEITEYKLNFAGHYNWREVSTRIKAGSVIEISGAGTTLYFYENKTSTPQKIEGRGVADADYYYVNNHTVNGDFNIKVTERSKISVLVDDFKAVEDKVDAFSKPQANLILTEPIALSSTSEHCLYLDDAVEGDNYGMKYGLTSSQFTLYGSVAYVDKPAVGTKNGAFLALSVTECIRETLVVKGVAPVPKEINILDIGSSYIDIGAVTQRQYENYVRDGYTVNIIGTMGCPGKRHEARSGGTWDFLVKPLGRAVILDVSGVTDLPTTGYPGTTYQDENGVKWSVRGLVINGGTGKLVLSSFSVDTNYGDEGSGTSTDYDIAAANLPLIGTLTKTTNDSTGTSTDAGDDAIQYTGKELVYYNPFWNPVSNEFDFAYYINKWGFSNPDIITLTFGSNDLGNFSEASQADVDAVVAKAVSVVNRIHEQLPNCKVLITCSCYGYKGIGKNDFRVVYRIKNIQKYYKTLIDRMGQSTSYGDYVRIVPTMCMIDRENGFWISEKVIHSSYPAVKCADDIVHPNTAGFNQFADAMLGYAYELL